MIRRLLAGTGCGKILLLWGFSLAFGFSTRTGGETTLLLHLLAVLNDQYYFIFAILPIILFLCVSVMEDDAEVVILRYGRYGRYFMTKWLALAQLCGLAWLGQMVILFLTGWGFPTAGGWMTGTWSGQKTDVFLLLERIFPNPETALLCAAVHLLAGYMLIGLLVLWLGHFLSRSTAVRALAVLYILTVLWIKVPAISEPPFCFLTFLNHWIMLLHNLTEPWRFPLTIIVTLFFINGMLWSVYRRWRRSAEPAGRLSKGLAAYYRRILFCRGNWNLLVGSIALLTAWTLVSGISPTDGSEWIIRLLAGHGTGYFHMTGFLTMLLVQIIPLWPIGGLLSHVVNGKGALQIIRLRRREKLLGALMYVSFLWLFASGVLLLGAEIIPPLLLAVPFDMKLAVVGVGLHILDMGFQLLLFLLVLCYMGQTTAGFLFVLTLHFLCVLPVPWLPVGLSSLLRIHLPETGGVVPISAAAAELAAGWVILLIWLERYGIRRLFEKNGGLL